MEPVDRKTSELADERLAEKRYALTLHANVVKQSIKGGPHSSVSLVGELLGRVALSHPDWMLGDRNDFYIGEKHANVDGVEVYSWAAPVACTFFRQNHRHASYEGLGELCDDVAVIRTFTHSNGRIHDFSDDVVGSDVPTEPFTKRGLTIPAPPSRRSLPRSAINPGGAPRPEQGTAYGPMTVPRHGAASTWALTAVRAEAALRAQLRAPRTKSLASVLATMQPDQYELVALPAMQSVIIEGQPGTGKTIVAAHRAAYVLSEQTPSENSLDGMVLLVGPTSGYSKHVRSVVHRLADRPQRVKVLSLPELMQMILGLNAEPTGMASTSWQDVDWRLGRFTRSAISRLQESPGGAPTIDQVYECLRQNGSPKNPITNDADLSKYLRRLPPLAEALLSGVHLPLLAFIKWEVSPPDALLGIELIIVDEAQDVSELEWVLLEAINKAQAWTVVGDLNQRRSDHTPSSWAAVLELISVDVETPIRALKRGYRSTKPILEFGNRLLPRKERSVVAFQEEGPAPVVEKVETRKLGARVVRQVERLQLAYPQGTVAVIGADTTPVTKSLRACGWRTTGSAATVWEHHEREVTVVDADSARGLEFDAVVVVEPSAFAQNLARSGPLYTALTRPNRELVVVHSAPLPAALLRA